MNKTFTNKAGNLVLELRQDTMSAWLTIKQTGKLINENEILALIDEAGIKTGFDEAIRYIRENSLDKEFGVPFPIAICNIKESSSTLRYHFNPDQQIDFGKGINFNDLENLSYVESNSVVADYSNNIFEQGGSIYDIFGELIQPGNIDEEKATALAGDNVIYDAPNREFIAQKTGYPHLDDSGRINILDVIVIDSEDIPGDASFRTPLEMAIKGDLACANLICGGNLTVNGNIHSSSIYCAKDMFVEGDILDCNNCAIQVMGELSCNGMRDSKVLCKKQLRFQNKIENCSISCEGEILGHNLTSEICGGNTQAGGSISIAKAGSVDGKNTEIEIAISPFQRALLMQMTRELVLLKEDPEANEIAINDLQSKINKCELELDEELNAFLRRSAEERKRVRILREAIPPTTIRILKNSYQIKSPERGLELVEKD